jgi:hypothetical protein
LPTKLKVADEASITFDVINNGKNENVAVEVHVDDERIYYNVIKIKPETVHRVGVHPHQKILWKVRGGPHRIKAVIPNIKDSDGGMAAVTMTVEPMMRSIKGIDLIIDNKSLSYHNKTIQAHIYNRGNKTAQDCKVLIRRYPSKSESSEFIDYIDIEDVRPHELKTVAVRANITDSKIVVNVDPIDTIYERNENNNTAEIIVGNYSPEQKQR